MGDIIPNLYPKQPVFFSLLFPTDSVAWVKHEVQQLKGIESSGVMVTNHGHLRYAVMMMGKKSKHIFPK